MLVFLTHHHVFVYLGTIAEQTIWRLPYQTAKYLFFQFANPKGLITIVGIVFIVWNFRFLSNLLKKVSKISVGNKSIEFISSPASGTTFLVNTESGIKVTLSDQVAAQTYNYRITQKSPDIEEKNLIKDLHNKNTATISKEEFIVINNNVQKIKFITTDTLIEYLNFVADVITSGHTEIPYSPAYLNAVACNAYLTFHDERYLKICDTILAFIDRNPSIRDSFFKSKFVETLFAAGLTKKFDFGFKVIQAETPEDNKSDAWNYAKGFFYLAHGDLALAERIFRNVARSREDKDYVHTIDSLLAKQYLAKTYQRQQRYNRAMVQFSQIVNMKYSYASNVNKGLFIKVQSESLFDMGNCFYALGLHEHAIAKYLAIEELLDKNDFELLNKDIVFSQLGISYARLGNWTLAHKYLQDAVNLNPSESIHSQNIKKLNDYLEENNIRMWGV